MSSEVAALAVWASFPSGWVEILDPGARSEHMASKKPQPSQSKSWTYESEIHWKNLALVIKVRHFIFNWSLIVTTLPLDPNLWNGKNNIPNRSKVNQFCLFLSYQLLWVLEKTTRKLNNSDSSVELQRQYNKTSDPCMSNEKKTRILSSLLMWTPLQLQFGNWNKVLIAKEDNHTI